MFIRVCRRLVMPVDRATITPMPLLTLKETQSVLKLSRSTVLQFIYSGALPASKLGRSWRVAPKDLAAFVQSRRQA